MNATLTPMKSIGGSFTPAGPAGFSPTFAVEDIDGGHRITITDKNGTQIVDVMDGADGFAPTITVVEIAGGHRLTITDKNGTKTVDIMDGEDGVSPAIAATAIDGGHRLTITDASGSQDVDIMDGEDGVSPTVTVADIAGGHRLTVTDKNGTHTVDVMNGEGSGDMVAAVYDPQGKAQDVFSYADEAAGNVQKNLSDHADNDAKHITAEERDTWNSKSEFSGDYNDLENKPTIPTVPTYLSSFENDVGYLTQHQDISGKLDVGHATDRNAHSGMFASANDLHMKIIFGLAQIGLTRGSETIESIAKSLPNYSVFYDTIIASNNTGEFPSTGGLLRVVKLATSRILFEFDVSVTVSTSSTLSYFGVANASGDTVAWTGWHQKGRFVYGSYSGTGTSGSSNKNSLSFPFAPRVLFIKKDGEVHHQVHAIAGEPSVAYLTGNYSTAELTMSWNGKTVRWYSTSAANQLNISGEKYHYFGIN